MSKKIGLVGNFTGGNSFGITKPYLFFWSQFGEVSLISPFEKEARDLDLLVMPGGPDVAPWRYLDADEDIHVHVGQPCMQRERFDKVLLPKYMMNGTPIFGTCRGMQSIYVQLGGKLNQHMSHETNSDSDGSKLVHAVKFENLDVVPGLSELVASFKGKEYKINSRHHQTVNEETKPNIVTILARHDKDDEIEFATTFPHYPAHLTQHHVEDVYDKVSIYLINHLLNL